MAKISPKSLLQAMAIATQICHDANPWTFCGFTPTTRHTKDEYALIRAAAIAAGDLDLALLARLTRHLGFDRLERDKTILADDTARAKQQIPTWARKRYGNLTTDTTEFITAPIYRYEATAPMIPKLNLDGSLNL